MENDLQEEGGGGEEECAGASCVRGEGGVGWGVEKSEALQLPRAGAR